MDHEKFAACVKKARTGKGMTQKELASRIHVSDKAVSKWERGLSFPDIELLGPLSQELDIPLSVLLDVEELAVTAGDSKGQGFETLLSEVLALVKEKAREELRSKKRILRIMTAILAILIVLAAVTSAWNVYTNVKRMEAYEESIHIFSEEDIEIVSIEEKDGIVYLDLCIRNDEALRYGVMEYHWYDEDDPTVACVQFYCYEKEYLAFDSIEEYTDHRAQNTDSDSKLRKIYVETGVQQYKNDQIDRYTGFASAYTVEHDLLGRDSALPVSKIVYRASEDHPEQDLVLWEASGN